jgi:hypothetical protein
MFNHKQKNNMVQKPRKTTAESIKKSLSEMRQCLDESIVKDTNKSVYRLRFSRIGTSYRIENAPIPKTDKIGKKLELSFNDFMRKLKVNYDGMKVEGLCFIGKDSDSFVIGYQNYKVKGQKVVSNVHKIKGMMG